MRKILLIEVLILLSAFAARIEVPAVTPDERGVKVELECEVIPGHGRILVATEPLVGISTQESERNAVKAVEKLLNVSFDDKDVIFIFHANTTRSIDGGSAGVAMAVCLVAEVLNRTPNNAVSVTGAIDEEGNVLPVGGILQKAQAMKDKAVFLIPKGQGVTYTYTKRYYSPAPGVYVEEVYPVMVNISEYAMENWNLKVVEISRLEEALKWFFNESIERKKEVSIVNLPEFDPLPRLSKIAEMEIERAKEIVAKNNNSIGYEMLTKAMQTPAGYDYTRANYAFLAIIASERNFGDIETLARKLEEEFKKTPTSDPYWRAEAELRLSWALFNAENPIARKEWLIIAARMFSMEKRGNKVIDTNFVKSRANEMIMKAKKEIEDAKMAGVPLENAESSLNMALRSYEEGLYFAALYNAIDAIAWAKASLGSSFNISSPYEDEFSEAYRRHAIYLLFKEKNKRGAAFSALRAQLRKDVFKNSSLLPLTFRIPHPDLKTLTIFLLLAYIISEELKKKKKTRLSEKELAVLLEVKAEAVKALRRKFENKEISQDEYYRILKELEGL